MIFHSIKWRLQAWHGLLLVLLVAGLMTGFYTYQRRSRLAAVDTELREIMTPLLPKLAPPGSRGGRGFGERERRPPPEEIDRMDRPLLPVRFYYATWDADDEPMMSSDNLPERVFPPDFGTAREGSLLRTRGEYREIAHLIPNGMIVLVGTSLSREQVELHRLALVLTLAGISVVTVGLTVGWWLAARALRPLVEISLAAQKIAAGDLSNRINVSETESELGQLIVLLNSTFARLDSAFAQQQQFTSDAAHELRTPVSVILTQVQSTLNKERSGAEYRETLEACQRAALRMKRLIESLLELARFDAGQEQLLRVPFDLAVKVRESVDLLQPLAAERRVKIVLELTETNCTADPERLSQVIINLLTNAVTYNKPDREVRVLVTTQGGNAVLTVTDSGPGIALEDAPHVFKRFYRADKSRSGNSGNAGLGLAICQSIVAAHGGTLEFMSEPGRGTTFTLRLPTV